MEANRGYGPLADLLAETLSPCGRLRAYVASRPTPLSA